MQLQSVKSLVKKAINRPEFGALIDGASTDGQLIAAVEAACATTPKHAPLPALRLSPPPVQQPKPAIVAPPTLTATPTQSHPVDVFVVRHNKTRRNEKLSDKVKAIREVTGVTEAEAKAFVHELTDAPNGSKPLLLLIGAELFFFDWVQTELKRVGLVAVRR